MADGCLQRASISWRIARQRILSNALNREQVTMLDAQSNAYILCHNIPEVQIAASSTLQPSICHAAASSHQSPRTVSLAELTTLFLASTFLSSICLAVVLVVAIHQSPRTVSVAVALAASICSPKSLVVLEATRATAQTLAIHQVKCDSRVTC